MVTLARSASATEKLGHTLQSIIKLTFFIDNQTTTNSITNMNTYPMLYLMLGKHITCQTSDVELFSYIMRMNENTNEFPQAGVC